VRPSIRPFVARKRHSGSGDRADVSEGSYKLCCFWDSEALRLFHIPLRRSEATITLTVSIGIPTLSRMVVHLKPETESRLKTLSAATGRDPDDLVEDAMAGYLAELAQTREMLDARYDDIKTGQVKAVDGEEAFNRIRTKSNQRRRP
jgi:hypothetical protein